MIVKWTSKLWLNLAKVLPLNKRNQDQQVFPEANPAFRKSHFHLLTSISIYKSINVISCFQENSHILLSSLISTHKMSNSIPIPFSDPPWLMGLPSAYYNDSHRAWQKTCRKLVDELLMKDATEWERAGDVPGTYFPLRV